MNRDSARKLSDSDFWQICHEMHPSTNYTFPVAPPTLGVSATNSTMAAATVKAKMTDTIDSAVAADHFTSNCETLDQQSDDIFDQHETSEEVSSDDSLQNLYMKKTRAHRKLMNTHSNCINTQKILDTIDLFCDNDDDDAKDINGSGKRIDLQNGKNVESKNDTNHNGNDGFKLGVNIIANEIDTINNTDDLLLKIADSVQQLKTNVNQLNAFNEKCETGMPGAYVVAGDLIDFSDDWTNGESDNNSNASSDKPIKKVTHSCVQGSPNDGVGDDDVGNERLPYVKFECRKNLLNNNTGRAAARTDNETQYDTEIEVNNHRSGIQVNYRNEWQNENNGAYPSPTTSESSSNSNGSTNCGSGSGSSSSSCSYTDSLSNSSRSTVSDNFNETETSNGHTVSYTNSNSHTLNTEHNRRYCECREQQCAHHNTRPYDKRTELFDINDKSLTQAVGWKSNFTAASTTSTSASVSAAAAAISHAKINIETNSNEDSSNGACAVQHTFTFTHTIRDINEVNSSIEPPPSNFGVEKATQDIHLATVSAKHSHSHTHHRTQPSSSPSQSSSSSSSTPNETKQVHVNTSIVVEPFANTVEPKPFAISSSSFIKPLPVDTSTSAAADTFSLQKQAEWDADKNNNPLHHKDKRTKALPICTVKTENKSILNESSVNRTRSFSAKNQKKSVKFSFCEKSVPNSHADEPNSSFNVNRKKSSANTASTTTTTPLFSCDADNKDENEHVVADVNRKICLEKNPYKITRCKLKYRNTVHGCLCEHYLRISVQKSYDKFNQSCVKRRRRRRRRQPQRVNGSSSGDGELKCRKKSTHCTKRQKSIDKKSKNRIGKQQQRCNYKWKCCRGHLCYYDLCETFPIPPTTNKCDRSTKVNPASFNSGGVKAFKSYANRVINNNISARQDNCSENFATSDFSESEKTTSATSATAAKVVVGIADRFVNDDTIENQSHQLKCDGNSAANVTLPFSSINTLCNAIKTISTKPLANDTNESLTAINKTIRPHIRSDNNNKEKEEYNNLIGTTKASTSEQCEIDDDDVDDNGSDDAVIELKKTLELSPPIEKIKQVLDAVKCSDTNLCITNSDLNRSFVDTSENATSSSSSKHSDRIAYRANSLKNSSKFSESCDSIFTLKRSGDASSTSSLLSLNASEPFEASNRLRRLEERFKDFAITSLVNNRNRIDKCVKNNLSHSFPTLPTISSSSSHRSTQLKSKGHLDDSIKEEPQQQSQQRQIIETSTSSSSCIESLSKSVTDKSHAQPNNSIINNDVINNNGNGHNLNYSDSNNNDIKLKTHINDDGDDQDDDDYVEPNEETKQHICCLHTLQKRKQNEHLKSGVSCELLSSVEEQVEQQQVRLRNRKSPIGVEEGENFIENDSAPTSTLAPRQSEFSTSTDESIDIGQKKAIHSTINEVYGLNFGAPSSAATNESHESSLKRDSIESQHQHKKIQRHHTSGSNSSSIRNSGCIENGNEEIVDDKRNPISKSSSKSSNDDHLKPKIDTYNSNNSNTIGSGSGDTTIIHFDDNKNNLEQILNDKNEPNGINQNEHQNDCYKTFAKTTTELNKEKVFLSSKENTNEIKEISTNSDVQQLDNIANRLINCTPVSISTESEEICNLFPENHQQQQRIANESAFIYRDEELKTNCVFDVRQLSDFHVPVFDQIYECYDELDDDNDDDDEDDDDDDDDINGSDIRIFGVNVNQSNDHLNNTDNDAELTSCESEQLNNFPATSVAANYCQCTIESIVPLYTTESEAYNTTHTTTTTTTNTNKQNNNNKTQHCSTNKTVAAAIMRDMTSSGTLRGLLKKPNRPAPSQKNRVIFDETRNEFFDADYIILVRDDCPYDEEDEEPCTCGEHELVRLCCDEGCQCTAYAEDGRTPQSPKYAPPIEFVDQAALSPPEGYKDGGLQQALGGVLGSHIFGAQHIQQLQVIQRLQAKRAAMLAAQRSNNNGTNQSGGGGSSKNHSIPPPPLPAQTICTECAECSECAAKQEHDEALPHMALLSIQATSPERRFTQKEIIAGEERPKYLLIKQHQDSVSSSGGGGAGTNNATTLSAEKSRSSKNATNQQQRYVVETITMTTVTERRVLHEETNSTNSIITPTAATAAAAAAAAATSSLPPASSSSSLSSTTTSNDKSDDAVPKTTISAGNEPRTSYLHSDISLKPTSISAQITGILKGGKLWKNETAQSEETTSSATSDDETSKRSVRFIDGGNTKTNDLAAAAAAELDQDVCDGESMHGSEQNGGIISSETESTDTDTLKKHTMLFHNSLRPNSAVRQLFPTAVLNTNVQPAQTLTHEALRAFDESKRSQLKPNIVHSDSETDTIRRTIERNALRRSLIKYEPKKKLPKPDTSLEERIRMLTCDVDEPSNENSLSVIGEQKTLERRSSPTGEENPAAPHPQVTKYVPDKSFSPISTASSSSNSSISAYKKITDIFHKDKRQERIPEADENPIVIIPQQLQADCRCPPGPDLGMGSHLPNANNQLATVRPSDARRQFLSTLAPLTACVAGQRDDMSFYSLATGDRNSTGSSRGSEYSIGDIDAILQSEDAKKVAPDVIAGTPGQEQNDELAAFAQQEATRTERIKKRYNNNTEANSAVSVPTSNAGSDDDDEQNDYGFNHRPSVRGIKPRSNEEMLEEMQTQLSSASATKPPPLLPRKGGQSNTLPKASTQSLQSKLMTPVQVQSQQTQSQQQIASIVHQQNISTWNAYYQEQAQRNSLPANTPAAYFQHLPIHAARHSFHQEESTIYQNCQGVAMEQHYGHTIAARSPTRRPESPPPLRNYHQTMVLIPYNTEYAQFTADQIAAQHFQHQNILEYQQVTQQTIRVPIGYPLPGMQLHVVTGNGNGNQPAAYAQYATTTRQQTQMNAATPRPTYGYIQENQVPAAVKYTERGAPEGAASISQTDSNAVMQTQSVPNHNNNNNNNNNVQGNNSIVVTTSASNNTQTSNTSTTAQQQQQQQQGAVFYAMNV